MTLEPSQAQSPPLALIHHFPWIIFCLSRIVRPECSEGPRAESCLLAVTALSAHTATVVCSPVSIPGRQQSADMGQVTRGTLAHNPNHRADDRAETLRAPCHGCLPGPLPTEAKSVHCQRHQTSCRCDLTNNLGIFSHLMFNSQQHTLETIWQLRKKKKIKIFLLMLISF